MKRRPALIETLRAHPFLSEIKARHTRILAAAATDRIFAAGDFLGRQGEPADHFYLLREGRVALEIHLLRRPGRRLVTLHAGDVLGWSWLTPQRRWHLDARALDPVRAVALDARRVREACEADHELGFQIMKRFARILGQRLLAARLRLAHSGVHPRPRPPLDRRRPPAPAI